MARTIACACGLGACTWSCAWEHVCTWHTHAHVARACGACTCVHTRCACALARVGNTLSNGRSQASMLGGVVSAWNACAAAPGSTVKLPHSTSRGCKVPSPLATTGVRSCISDAARRPEALRLTGSAWWRRRNGWRVVAVVPSASAGHARIICRSSLHSARSMRRGRSTTPCVSRTAAARACQSLTNGSIRSDTVEGSMLIICCVFTLLELCEASGVDVSFGASGHS